MRLVIDTSTKKLEIENQGKSEIIDLYSKKAFELISHQWMKVGWNQKYPYAFSWFGRPIIQIPEDIVRMQEVIYQVKPDVIVETGVAHGGSLIFYASLFKAMGKGRVVGIDIEIRPHNRQAVEKHELSSLIHLIEGDSVGDETIRAVKKQINVGEKVMVVLDSNHTYEHVYKEIQKYHHLVSVGSYLVVTDGSMRDLHDVPRAGKDWKTDNPVTAAHQFLSENPDFVLERPKWPFNESELTEVITHWPDAWLKRVR